MENVNRSSVTEFILGGFPRLKNLNFFFFFGVLIIYMLTMTGNVVIILITRSSPHLQTPMYFFISNFSFLEIWYISVTIPKMLEGFLLQENAISLRGCLLQMYFFLALGATECFILAAMAYDRYVAICFPLHYPIIMNMRLCCCFIVCSWAISFLLPFGPVILISKLNFCEPNIINHFFCDILPVLRLACTDTFLNEMLSFFICSTVIVTSFILIMASYISIVSAILRIPSAAGQRKAFSTCASHLTVVLIFYGTTIFMYGRPRSKYSFEMDKVVAVLYCVITPVLNPIIYSLRNKDVKEALRKTMCRKAVAEKACENEHYR